SRWFQQAAEAGDPQAQNELGRLLFTGLGGVQDPAAALTWFEKAAASGSPDYIFDFASALETASGGANMPRVVDLYTRAAQAGHVEAAVSLAMLYQTGTGVDQNLPEAVRLNEIGVTAGSARAQNNLGQLLARGEGIEQDYARAAELFSAAANQGLGEAMGNLGVLYENGFGVPQDTEKADALYRMSGGADLVEQREKTEYQYDPRLAAPPSDAAGQEALNKGARADDPVALFQLGWLLVTQPDPKFSDWIAAYQAFEKGAERGHGPSMANLSLMYFKGQGAPQDYVLGHMWMLMAKRAGAPTPTLDALFSKTATSDQVLAAQSRAADMLEDQGAEIHP
ncbi:MAG: hypothetical protein AAF231_13395, partial [Pseudomonadota bacterium]